MNRILRPRFDRHADYVAIGYPKKGVNTNYKLGEDIIGVPVWRMRSLYRKKKIGIKGHPWTEKMLAIKKNRQEKFSGLSKKEIEEGRRLGPSEIANLEAGTIDIGSITAPADADRSDNADTADKSSSEADKSEVKKTANKSKTKTKSKPKTAKGASKPKSVNNGKVRSSANSATNGASAGGQ